MTLRELERALCGKIVDRRRVIAPWPGAGQFRQLWAEPHHLAPGGFICGPVDRSDGGTIAACREYVVDRLRGLW
jgi:hypothetical protein